jgi:hypothetical protein
VRALMMPVSRFTCRLSASAMGQINAMPTPPPTATACSYGSISVGMPSGPATSRMIPPRSIAASWRVLSPTAWKTMVIESACGSAAATVRGTRSPVSEGRTMTNWPTLRATAMRGARMVMR